MTITHEMLIKVQQLVVVVMLMLMAQLRLVDGHGYVMDPPQRSSMWRFGYDTPINHDDDHLFCGGVTRQWKVNGGKCGICGDPYDTPDPKPNEAGGMYATGIIVRTYHQADVITVTVKLTSSHGGSFVFKLCPNNDVTKEATQECLDRNVLQVVKSEGRPSEHQFYLQHGITKHHVRLQLPSDVTCTQCVLQWTYRTVAAGNSWGCDNTGCCNGCGDQENLVNCVDIVITPTTGPVHQRQNSTTTTTTTTGTGDSTAKKKCRPTEVYKSVPKMEEWCQLHCAVKYCPATHCVCQ